MFLSIGPVRGALAVCAVSLAGSAHADFNAALKDYNEGRVDAARTQFLSLAELGDCPSQFNLGAMALKGQGGPQDRGAGVGWLQAALSNGCRQQVGERLPGLQASLSPEQSRAAQAILERYGHDALQAQGVVNPNFECPALSPAIVRETPTPEYPRLRTSGNPEALVVTAFTIGVDGYARDPQVLLAVPEEGFPAAAIEAWLNSRFLPAMHAGVSVESRLQAKLRFIGSTGNLAAAPAYRAAMPAADSGDPAAQYLVGLTATLDSSLGVMAARAGGMLIESARAGNARSQYWVALQLRAAAACHPQANWQLWLQHAAEGGEPAAQADYAAELLRGTPTAEQVAQARAFLERAAASGDYYARKHAAALLAASPVAAVRDPARARSTAETLLHANQIQSDPQMFEVVAAAYAASHEYGNAVAAQHEAIQKALNLGWNTALMNERLAAYRHDAPWVGDLYAGAPGAAPGRP
jgi:TPR repeat protein